MKQAFRKSKPLLIMLVGAWLIGMSFFFSACTNSPSAPSGPIGYPRFTGGSGSSGNNPTVSPTVPPGNYVVGAVGYELTSVGSAVVTTYVLAADVAVSGTPCTNAAVTFTDPNGTTQYFLSYTGSNQTLNGVNCGIYQLAPSSFTTIGTFGMTVLTSAGTSSASVTAVNSTVTFPFPYTTLSWTGSSQENTVSVVSEATPSVSYGQNSTTSPMSIPVSTYTAGVTYSYLFLQTNANSTLSSGSGEFGYVQITSGSLVGP